MTIRVLIERQVDPGQEAKLQQIMTQSRVSATKASGYISGETLRALDSPGTFIVLSNWNTVDDWKLWEKSPERAKIQQQLAPLLLVKEKCTVLTHI